MKLCLVGTGMFARSFVPLFKAHPLVGELSLADLDPDKLGAMAAAHGGARTFPSLEAACASDVDAIALFTANWAHAPQAVQALRAGKHVYSAVPAAVSLDELRALCAAVAETGRTYMLGETSYYSATALYCRQRWEAGDFGHLVHAEASYYHDFDHNLYGVFKIRGGDDWKRYAGSPPMHYATHSVGAVLAVTGSRLVRVSCQGWVDRHEDGLFRVGVNAWDNVFSDQCALFKAADGSSVRINEFRRVGGMTGEQTVLVGTEGSFEASQLGAVWLSRKGEPQRLDDVLRLHDREVPGRGVYKGVSAAHPIERLPASFVGHGNSHGGSHPFLVHEFVEAVVAGRRPAIGIRQAARYCAPGLVAHASARADGALLEIPPLSEEAGAAEGAPAA